MEFHHAVWQHYKVPVSAHCGKSSSNQSAILSLQETQRLVAEPVPGIVALPDENNARYFHVTVAGPEEVSIAAFTHKC